MSKATIIPMNSCRFYATSPSTGMRTTQHARFMATIRPWQVLGLQDHVSLLSSTSCKCHGGVPTLPQPCMSRKVSAGCSARPAAFRCTHLEYAPAPTGLGFMQMLKRMVSRPGCTGGGPWAVPRMSSCVVHAVIAWRAEAAAAAPRLHLQHARKHVPHSGWGLSCLPIKR